MIESVPYDELKISENEFIRKFSFDSDPEDLKWHQDEENRLVVVLSDGGWFFQMENCLPIPLCVLNSFHIPKMEWHRVIRGDDDLIIKIYKS